MSTLTLIRFVERETVDFPARRLDNRLDNSTVERRIFQHLDPLPRVGDEIVTNLSVNIPAEPSRTWYGRKKETYEERNRVITLTLDKITHDTVAGVIQLDCRLQPEKP